VGRSNLMFMEWKEFQPTLWIKKVGDIHILWVFIFFFVDKIRKKICQLTAEESGTKKPRIDEQQQAAYPYAGMAAVNPAIVPTTHVPGVPMINPMAAMNPMMSAAPHGYPYGMPMPGMYPGQYPPRSPQFPGHPMAPVNPMMNPMMYGAPPPNHWPGHHPAAPPMHQMPPHHAHPHPHPPVSQPLFPVQPAAPPQVRLQGKFAHLLPMRFNERQVGGFFCCRGSLRTFFGFFLNLYHVEKHKYIYKKSTMDNLSLFLYPDSVVDTVEVRQSEFISLV
jgi:hypothetical protein